MKIKVLPKPGFSAKVSIIFSLIYIFAILMIIFFIFWGIPFTPINGHIHYDRLDFYEDLNLIANMKKEQILHWIQDRCFDIEIFSNDAFLSEDIIKLRLEISDYLEGGELPDEIWLKLLLDKSYQELSDFLEYIRNSSGFYSNIYIADPETGIVFFSTDTESLGLKLSGMNCFYDSTLTETVHVGDCPISPDSKNIIIHFSHVMKDKLDNTIGIMLITIDQNVVQSLLFSPTSGFRIREEVILVNNRAEILIPLKYPLIDGKIAEINKYRIKALPVKFAVRGEESIIDTLDYRGQRVLAAYRFIRMNSEWGWGLVVKRDYSELINPIKTKIITALVISCFSGVILAMITILFIRGITSPIRNLKRTTELITNGNLHARAIVQSEDEIGILAKAFNHMTDNLVDAKENLEFKVKERTHELEKEIDIRRSAEASMRKLSYAIEQSPSVVIITDINFNIEYVNPMFTQISGYSLEEVIGQNPDFLNFSDYSSKMQKEVKKRILAYQIYQTVFHNKKKDGNEYWVSASISGIKNEDGILTNILEVQQDITQEKELQEQLVQAQKLESIGTLAGGVAHDFNNILSVVQGYSEYLLSKLDKDDRIYPMIQDIKEASNRGASLTGQLLAFSRKQIVQMTVLDLNDLLVNIKKMLIRLMSEDVNISLVLEEYLWKVEADPGQMDQILMNMAVNSSHAMPEGGSMIIRTGNIEIKQSDPEYNRKSGEGEFVFLSIKDTGCGMDEITLSRIFDPFFTTKLMGKGTGLGLSVVYGIVEQHKGWINVQSIPNKGTEFVIYLPAIKNQEINYNKELSPIKKLGHGEKILLVEDDKALCSFAIRVLTENGYSVFSAASVDEVFEMFNVESEEFDLIFSDVMLPGISGVKLVEFFIEQNPKVKLLLTSGYTDEKSHWDYIHKKDYNFLQKPYTMDILLNKIAEILVAF